MIGSLAALNVNTAVTWCCKHRWTTHALGSMKNTTLPDSRNHHQFCVVGNGCSVTRAPTMPQRHNPAMFTCFLFKYFHAIASPLFIVFYLTIFSYAAGKMAAGLSE